MLFIISCCFSLTIFSQNKSEVIYALVTKVYNAERKQVLEVDYVQMLTGKKAVNAAKLKGEAEYEIQSGDTTWYVPNDFYVLNDNTKRRQVPVSEQVVILLIRRGTSKLSKGTFNEFKKIHTDKIFRLTIVARSIVKIEEFYTP